MEKNNEFVRRMASGLTDEMKQLGLDPEEAMIISALAFEVAHKLSVKQIKALISVLNGCVDVIEAAKRNEEANAIGKS